MNPSTLRRPQISPVHRSLVIVSVIFSVALISVGGVLCVTGSIRSCPDWPGCFGKLYPPLALSPVLEYAHRVLAALTGLSVFGTAAMGLVRTRQLPWLVIPPLIASGLVILVSVFGALVVLRGLAPGWAAVDLGSALLVVALMVTTAVMVTKYRLGSWLPGHLRINTPLRKLSLAAVVVIYSMLVSGMLVAGSNAVISCIGWPIFSSLLYQQNAHLVGNMLRLGLSVAGVVMLAFVIIGAWRQYRNQSAVVWGARFAALGIVVEAILQILILALGFRTKTLVFYTVTMAITWGLLCYLAVNIGLDADT